MHTLTCVHDAHTSCIHSYKHTHTNTHIYIYIHIYIHARAHTCTRTRSHNHRHTDAGTHTCTHTCTCTHRHTPKENDANERSHNTYIFLRISWPSAALPASATQHRHNNHTNAHLLTCVCALLTCWCYVWFHKQECPNRHRWTHSCPQNTQVNTHTFYYMSIFAPKQATQT